MNTTEQGKWFVALALCGLVASGCSTRGVTVGSFGTPQATPVAGYKPAVTLLRIEDAITDPAYRADPTLLGEGTQEFITIFVVIPLLSTSHRFSGARPRTELVQSAFMAKLPTVGLPIRYQSGGSFEQFTNRDDGHLLISVRLKKFQVDTKLNAVIPFILSNGFLFDDIESHVVLECRLFQPGNPTPLWQGTVEGKTESDAKSRGDKPKLIQKTIMAAVEQFVQKSNFQQHSTRLRNDAYATHLKAGQVREAAGDINGAMASYGKAYSAAPSSEKTLELINIVAQAANNHQGKPILPEDVRRYGVQAISLVEQKRYDDAVMAYAQAMELAPWWSAAHFDQALILASQNQFTQAIPGMKRYLLLAPGAGNARAAQDKIYEWESKAK